MSVLRKNWKGRPHDLQKSRVGEEMSIGNLLDKSIAVCPECGAQVVMVDEDSDLYSCIGEGCGWVGKFVQLDF